MVSIKSLCLRVLYSVSQWLFLTYKAYILKSRLISRLLLSFLVGNLLFYGYLIRVKHLTDDNDKNCKHISLVKTFLFIVVNLSYVLILKTNNVLEFLYSTVTKILLPSFRIICDNVIWYVYNVLIFTFSHFSFCEFLLVGIPQMTLWPKLL